ncbi:phosphatase PAP2 family protein [Pseudoduganella plicata]|uniref:Phosphatase PAP2 family protein n=2 Tax=Pseudoduganella plicata TaxID=321984 RepID=A0ABX5S7L0_9BURK|nr:phosphatase PAP2 family protein [Pseudoduganella plicata]QBQ35590.1 phosphatase PAP2 family protein [Pseudoduganella plicata]
MMSGWSALSALGSISVTGPLGIAIAVWLLAGRSWRLSLSWCLMFGAGMALVVATKVAYVGWGIGIPEMKFAGLSGHAMRACAVFPVVFYLAVRRMGSPARRVALGAGTVLALLISFSRLPVLAHSMSEVVLGGAVGFAVAAGFVFQARSEHPATVGRVLLALCMPVMLVMPFTEPVHTERWVQQLALQLSGRTAPIERAWKLGQDKARPSHDARRPARDTVGQPVVAPRFAI